jgi:SAM-dependent methyltransferase
LNPRPTQAEIGAYYPETYKEYVMEVDDEPNAFLRWNRQYGMAKRCRVVTSQRRPGRLLDVGCGTGHFLAAMRRCGWQVDGEDMTPAAVRIARGRHGLNIFEGTLEEAAYPDESFDAVTLWNVIEHVPDPPATIREVARILKPDGLIVMGTPNVDAFDARIFGELWALWEAPRHFNVFSPKTLSRVLTEAGYSGVESRSIVGTWFGFVTSLQYLWEDRGSQALAPGDGTRPYWDMRLAMQAARLAALPYNWLTDRLGAGSTMVVTANRGARIIDEAPPAFLSRSRETPGVR